MKKIELFLLLVTVIKCGGQFPKISETFRTAKQLPSPLGLAQSILGGITHGLGINFGGHSGPNTQKLPESPNRPTQYYPQQSYPANTNTDGESEEDSNENYNMPPSYYHGHKPHHSHQTHPVPSHHRPTDYGSGYGSQGQYGQQYPNNYNNNNQNQHPHNHNDYNRPARPNNGYQGSYNNNNHGNYGNQYPNYHKPQNSPGHNQGYGSPAPHHQGHNNDGYINNNQQDQNHYEHSTHSYGSYNKPEYENNNQFNDNNHFQSTHHTNVNQGFPNNQQYSNSGTQYPFNTHKPEFPATPSPPAFNAETSTQEPKEDIPTFVPLNPVNKPVTEDKKTDEDADYNIDSVDIRFKDE